MEGTLVVIKGGGDLGSGVAHRLSRCGMSVLITEVEKPTVIRRMVSFAQAVYEGEFEVEGVTARKVESVEEAFKALDEGKIPVLVDEKAEVVLKIKPKVVVDAIMAKKNLGTKITDAPIVIGLGPGFRAGVDVHAVIETNRGHNLGRVIYKGEAEKDTGIPGVIAGYTVERVLRAPADGVFRSTRKIGDRVEKGALVASVNGQPVISQVSGVLRGLLQDNLPVRKGEKVGDVDARASREHCFTISDKSRAIGGGVLEAILTLRRRLKK